MSYIDIRLLHKFNIMRTTYNKLNNHALVFIEITKAWLFFIIIITKLANKAKVKYILLLRNFNIIITFVGCNCNTYYISCDICSKYRALLDFLFFAKHLG